MANLDFGEEVSSRALTGVAWLLALVVGIALAWSLRDWTGFLLLRIGRPFGEADPYFNADLGFFTYRLPFETMAFAWVTVVVLCTLAAVVFLYLLTPGLRWEGRRLHVSEYIRRHLAVLAGVLVLLLAWHFRLEMYGLLLHGSAPDGAFGPVDQRISIPAFLGLAIVTFAAGLVVIWAGWTGQRRMMFIALAAVLLTWVGARGVAPWVGARLLDAPASLMQERPYSATRAGYTRRAYAVDQVVLRDSSVSFASLQAAASGVPVWDALPLARAVEAETRVGAGGRVGWSSGSDGIVAMVSSPQSPPDPGSAAPVGIAVQALASAADAAGAPVRVLPPDADDEAQILAPSVILDSTPGFTVVPDSSGRIQGVSLSSPAERVVQGIGLRGVRLWTQELPAPHPVLVTLRGARQRVEALAPFLVQGSQVSALVSGDSLFWVIELYAASTTYPLSEPLVLAGATRTYFHHAATALVLSSTGRVLLLADGAPDPIAATWIHRFPGSFVTGHDVPTAVLRQLPPPLDQARAQALAFGRYGAGIANAPPLHPPVVDGADSTLAGAWLPIALPGAGPTALEIPLLDDIGRVQGLLVVTGGHDHRAVWHPLADALPHRWNLVLDQLAKIDSIHPAGGAVVHGVVRAVAVGTSAIFVQPVYQWSPGGVPRLLRVAWFANGAAHSGPTLRKGVGRPVSTPGAANLGAEPWEATARLYRAMQDALRRGDWLAFGRAFDALGTLLERHHP